MDTEPSWFREKMRVFCLTLCLLGLQFSWSVELAYGTPYLIKDIKLSYAVTALVWLAGPISGLIMQPVIGAYSDACTSRFGRRRPFMVAGTVGSVISCLMVGWAVEISEWFSSDEETVKTLTKFFAVLGFYLLDFAINGVQAACRALVIDRAGKDKQEVANAWAGRMISVGGMAGFFFGTLPLTKVFGGYLGNNQMQILCVFGSIFLSFFVGVTCMTNPEVPLQRASVQEKKHPFHALLSLKSTFKNLPLPARQVCNVQFFAWIGWMPFYFYTSQWVGLAYRREYPDRVAAEDAAAKEKHVAKVDGSDSKAGALAMLLFSIVCLFASFVLPAIIVPRVKEVQQASASRPWWRKIRDTITLSRMYTASHILFASCLLLTPFGLRNTLIATILPAIAGASYAVTAYAPFVILAECIEDSKSTEKTHQLEEGRELDLHTMAEKCPMTERPPAYPNLVRSSSQLTLCLNEVKPTKEMYEDDKECKMTSVAIGMPEKCEEDSTQMTAEIEGGAILGIMNCYIVAPQFLTSILAVIIFQVLGDEVDIVKGEVGTSDKDGIGWVLRVGGVSAMIAAYLSLRIK